MIKRFRKKPIVIEALQWTNDTITNLKEKVRESNKDRYPEQQRINPYQTIMLLEKALLGVKE